MSEDQPKTFYIKLERRDDGEIRASTISVDLPDFKEEITSPNEEPKEAEQTVESDREDFSDVVSSFRSAMDGYRNFIPLTLQMAPHLAHQLGFQSLEILAKEKGRVVADLTKDKNEVFALDIEHWHECTVLREKMEISVKGAQHLPEVMLIGLVSVYDSMLGRLLKAVFNRHEEIVFTSEKSIKFSDLVKYGSVEQAKRTIIDKEIEVALRESHHEQFEWMQKKFSVKLKGNLPVWPTFVEVCERRNLITHTGGKVSDQYLASGKENRFDVSGIAIAQKLEVTPAYYRTAVEAVYEVGAKLCHVFWRKFAEEQRADADDALNGLGYGLTVNRNYKLAEKILQFGVNLPKHSSDAVKRMMVVNLANAVRLQKGRDADAKAILEKEDWSAVEDRFKLCVAAVRGEEEKVVELMMAMGAGQVTAENYRNWPVFRGLRTNEKFAAAFQKIFGSRLLVPATAAKDKVEDVALEKSGEVVDAKTMLE